MKNTFFTFLLLGSNLLSGQTATLSGHVSDASKKTPVDAANVQVKGTSRSIFTDEKGNFELKNLKPGEYTIEVSLLGYERQLFTEIKLKAGEPYKLNVVLEQSVVTLDQNVKIVGKRPLVDVDKTQTVNTIGQDQIELAPVRQVQKLINTQVGVMNSPTGINIRGGRSYETGFYIDGVNATDPLGGTGFGIDLGANAMQDIEITTGGVGAEIGDATAGVVSARTKSGGEKTEFSLNYKRDNFGNYKNSPAVWNQQAMEMNLGGMLWKKKLKKKFKYYTTLRGNFSDEFYRNPAKQLVSSLYPNTFWSPYQDNRWSGMLKLNYDFSAKKKLSFTYLRSLTINQDMNMLRVTGNDVGFNPGYQYLFSKQMDNANTFTHDNYLAILNFQHTTSKRFFYKANLSRMFVNLRGDANGRPWRPASVDQQFDPDNIITFPSTYFSTNDSLNFVNPANGLYNNNGIATLWHHHYVEEYALRWNGTYFHGKAGNKLNFGTEMKFQELLWIDINRPWVGAPIQLANGQNTQSFRLGDASDIWKVNVRRGAAFVTDKIKYKGLAADMGLRFEYWAPGRFVDDAVNNPKSPIRDEIRKDYLQTSTKISGLRYKFRLLPKIAASFPIRENQMLYFNYGHSTILPHPSYIYQGLNPEYTDRSTLARLGNPNLNPEVDISYELGLKSQITSNDALAIAAYVKDKYDFITSASVLVADVSGRMVSRTLRINSDYARIRGLEVSYIKRIKTWFYGQASISYMNATGQSASASESLKELLATGAKEDTKDFYLPWDKPIDIKLNTTFKKDDKKGFFKGRLNKMAFYLEGTFRSGRRYTPYIFTGYEPATNRPIWVTDPNPESRNAKLGTNWFWMDLNFRKWWTFKKKYQLALTIEVTNIFNSKNAAIVNPVTGKAYAPGQDVPTEWQDPRYIDPRDPRSSSTPPTDPARYLEQRHYLLGLSFKL
ncbi:MAG: TonB-dependent receptor [Flavobacteriaceae bacterium]|nr:TonB-dependent receptor [Flavobacteriaceae bacterium]